MRNATVNELFSNTITDGLTAGAGVFTVMMSHWAQAEQEGKRDE
ncbi:hypothetical protein [Corynebacterium sputi]|nr:hypothetical protein [Corynebacterium sputi]